MSSYFLNKQNDQQTFDCNNVDHIKAFKQMCVDVPRRQSSIRFKLEFPYKSVPDMMMAKVAKQYVDMMLKKQ